MENNAEEWVRNTFADDIIPSDQSGHDEDYISLCPFMESGSWILVHEYLTGVRLVNENSGGSGNGQLMQISKFLDLFSDIIDVDKSTIENLVELLEYSEEKKIGCPWYFRLYLDRIKYGNLADVRTIFADLYSKFLKSKSSKRFQDILKANQKFRAFIQEQKSSEGEKEFFAL